MTAVCNVTLVSNYFGPLECAESSLFHFPNGIPGFQCERHFAAIEITSQRPLVYLQSINRPDLCLITLPVRTICPEFELDLAPEDAAVLGFPPGLSPRIGKEILCLAIIAVDEHSETTANLLAPLVVNLSNREAVQSIQINSDWSCRHSLAQLTPC